MNIIKDLWKYIVSIKDIISEIGAIAGVISAIKKWKGRKETDDASVKEIVKATLCAQKEIAKEYEPKLADKKNEIAELKKAIKALLAPEIASQQRRTEAVEALKQGNTKAALALFAEMEETVSAKKTEEGRKAAEFAKYQGAITYLNSPQEALGHYKRAADYDPADAGTWNRIGVLQARLGNLKEAEAAYLQALELGKRAKDKATIATVLTNLGVIAKIRGELDEAKDYYKQALTLSEEIGSKEGRAINLGNLGNIAQIQGELGKAEDYYNQSLALSEELGSKEGRAANLTNLGIIIIAKIRGELDEAKDYYKQALTLYKELGSKEGRAANLTNLGVIAQIRGELDEAKDYHNQALALSEELGSKEGRAKNLGNLGNIAKIRGEFDKAEDYLKQALALEEELGRQGRQGSKPY